MINLCLVMRAIMILFVDAFHLYNINNTKFISLRIKLSQEMICSNLTTASTVILYDLYTTISDIRKVIYKFRDE